MGAHQQWFMNTQHIALHYLQFNFEHISLSDKIWNEYGSYLAVMQFRQLPTFCRNIFPSSSGQKGVGLGSGM